jgi:HPt (histidine-containing phosphotransfer) domain-containing protein
VAHDDLLPPADRVAGLRELMSPEELRELYLMFADRTREAAALLRREPTALGLDEVERCVHDIKGTAATLGLDRVAEAAGQVLHAARTLGPAQALRNGAELISMLERLPAALTGEELMRRLEAPPP